MLRLRLAMTRESRMAAVGHNTQYNHLVLRVFSAVVLQLLLYDSVSGHGRLVEPPSRASMWRYGYATKPDVHDNQMWCGGFQVCTTAFLHLASRCCELANTVFNHTREFIMHCLTFRYSGR